MFNELLVFGGGESGGGAGRKGSRKHGDVVRRMRAAAKMVGGQRGVDVDARDRGQRNLINRATRGGSINMRAARNKQERATLRAYRNAAVQQMRRGQTAAGERTATKSARAQAMLRRDYAEGTGRRRRG